MDRVDVVSLGSASESEQEQAAAFRLAYVGRANRSTTNIVEDVAIASGRRPQDRVASMEAEVEAVARHRQASEDELRNASTRSSARIMRSQQAIVNHGVSSSSSPTERGKELSSYSPGFLALCVRSYTRHFHPIFPMLHLESIELSKGSLLYFAIAAIGNHFTSSAKMLEEGEQLFDQVWNVVSASLGEASDQGFENKTSLIQAALLLQNCALLSGADSYLSDAGQMHNRAVMCAAGIRLHETQHRTQHLGLSKAFDCYSSWQSWLSTEEKIRTVLALYYQDAELATVYHRAPLLDHGPSKVPQAAPDHLFTAPFPGYGSTSSNLTQLSNGSSWSLCTKLTSIIASITEARLQKKLSLQRV